MPAAAQHRQGAAELFDYNTRFLTAEAELVRLSSVC